MAFVATLTGTGRNCTLTSGSATMTVSSNTGLVVGATIQGTGIPAGTKINSISGTTVVMSANATASGTQSLIFSSVLGSTLTIVLNASGDVATWQNVFNAGFGLLQGTKSLLHPGALQITFGQIVAGATFNHQDWTVEMGDTGRIQFDSGLLAGRHLGGYDIAGALEVKSAGPTFVINPGASNPAGGYSLFTNTGGALTQGGTLKMHGWRIIVRAGSAGNRSPAFTSVRDFMDVENLILDYSEATGSNASIGCGFGTILNPKIIFANSGLSRTNANSVGNVVGLQFLGLFSDVPQAKFAIPNNSVMEAYAPQVTNTQFIGGFQDNTTETFANIDLSSPGWGLTDLITRYQRYGGPNTINFPRRVTFTFANSAGAALTGVTLFIRSGATTVLNAVQAGNYNANTQALVLQWTGSAFSYRAPNTVTNTISQVAQVRRYGFVEQSTSYSLNTAPYSQPFFMLADTSLSGISESAAAALTTVGIDWTNRTITPTADLTYDQINARIAWELAQTTNSAQADPRTIVGDRVTFATGWTLVVNSGVTITEGTNIKLLAFPTVTVNSGGQIQGLYSSGGLTNKILEINGVTDGSSLYVGNNATGITTLFQANTNQSTYRVYFAPGATPAQLVARELYPFQRSAQVINLVDGLNVINLVDIPDVGITEQDLATVQAYTAIETTSKFYDRTAAFRLTEQGIKLGQMVARSGTALEIGNFSHLINKDASLVYAVAGSTITTKSTSYAGDSRYQTEIATPPATITANTTEVITVNIEDANGNSQISINGGDGEFELWKVTTSTPTANYTDGTLLDTVGNGIYRFIGVSGFDIVGVDTNSNIRRRTSMGKGVYTQAFYVGDQIQLAQAPEVTEINTKVDVMQIALNAVQAKTDNLPASPAAVGDAMTLTTAYDAAKSAATQASVDALGEPLQVGDVVDANIVKVNNVGVDGTGTEADPWGPT